MSDWPTELDLAAASVSAHFFSNSISDVVHWSIVENPGWSILVVACASSVSGIDGAVLNGGGLHARERRSELQSSSQGEDFDELIGEVTMCSK